MSPSLPSQSFRPTPALELPRSLRELVAAMPIVIFARAIREAFFTPRKAR
jgi:hypothetical protein